MNFPPLVLALKDTRQEYWTSSIDIQQYNIIYSQICVKRPPMGKGKNGHL